MNVPQELSYSKEHEWIRVEGGDCTVGVTDYAQDQLGDVVFVELPEVGEKFAINDAVASVESVKAVSDIYLPLSGEIVAVNESILDSPELINDDPYGEGWIMKLRMDDSSELDGLLSPSDYENYVAEESE
jgi:glycine cleavage system H protein